MHLHYQVRQQQTARSALVEAATHHVEERVRVERQLRRVHLQCRLVALQSVHHSQLPTLLRSLRRLLCRLPTTQTVHDAVTRVQCVVHTVAVNLHGRVDRTAGLLKVRFGR